MAVSRILSGYNLADAIAAIVADVTAMISTDSRGVKVINRAALRTYLFAQFDLLEDTGVDGPFLYSPITGQTVQAAAASNTAMIEGYINELEAVLGEAAWSGRADWPFNATTGRARIASQINTLRAKASALSAEISSLYRWTQGDQLEQWVRNFYFEEDVDSAVPQGTQRIFSTRTYRCVYRTDKGELSKPSDASELVTIDQNDSVDCTAVAPPIGRFIDTVLWYRSNSSNAGAAFQYAGEKPVADGLTFSDTKMAEELAEACPSIEWDEPPAGLRGLRVHPGNFGVGYFDNTVCVSVANRLYAWPINWRKTTKHPIVGVEIGGQTIFVGTMGEPVLMTGADPAFLGAERVTGGEPCRSARSIVATHRGFMYAGANGIALCNGIGETPVLTRQHFTKQQWDALNPESIFAVEHDGCYYFWWNNGATSGCYSLGLDTGRLSEVQVSASAAFVSNRTGKLYAVSGTQIVEVFGGTGRRTAVWRSPRVAARGGFAWLKATSDYAEGALTVRWYRHMENGTTNLASYTATGRQPQRTHPGPAAMDEYEIEVEGQSALTSLVLTDSSEGLK